MKKLWILLCLFPLLAGCATVVHGTSQKIPVTSEPMGANVNIDGTANYMTPVTLELQRKFDHLLTISKEGYKTEIVKLIHTLSGAVAGNIIAGGLIGWGIDAASGAQYKLIPETVHVVLKPGGYVEKPEGVMHRDFEKDKVRLEYEKLNLERARMGLAPVEIPRHLQEPEQVEEEVIISEPIETIQPIEEEKPELVETVTTPPEEGRMITRSKEEREEAKKFNGRRHRRR